MGIRTDNTEANMTDETPQKTTSKTGKKRGPYKTKPPLAKKIKSGEPKDVYLQLCQDIAERMAITVSGRDYSAMCNAFLKSYDEYIRADESDEVKDAEVIKKEAEAASPIAQAQAQFKIVSVPKKVVNQ